MPAPLLTAALIVRDEERFLEGCLRSLAGVADEVVVVDTGSADRSREIARDLGARLCEHPWSGDFAAARNRGLDEARGEWILYIDADERVASCDRAALERQLGDPAYAAYTVRFRPLTGYTRYREHRLFRRHSEIRFRGVIHETHLPALGEVCRRTGWRIGDSDLALDHLGYDGGVQHKHARNLPLLRARLAEEPDHVYSLCHLGTTLQGLGDVAGAEAAWRRALDVVRRQPASTQADSLPYVELGRLLLERGEDSSDLLAEGVRLFPTNLWLVWLQARAHLRAGRCEAAIALLERLTAIDPEDYCLGQIAFDQRIFGVHAYDALGLCCFRLGRFAESAALYARASELEPENLEYRAKRWLAESRLAPRDG